MFLWEPQPLPFLSIDMLLSMHPEMPKCMYSPKVLSSTYKHNYAQSKIEDEATLAPRGRTDKGKEYTLCYPRVVQYK